MKLSKATRCTHAQGHNIEVVAATLSQASGSAPAHAVPCGNKFRLCPAATRLREPSGTFLASLQLPDGCPLSPSSPLGICFKVRCLLLERDGCWLAKGEFVAFAAQRSSSLRGLICPERSATPRSYLSIEADKSVSGCPMKLVCTMRALVNAHLVLRNVLAQAHALWRPPS